MSDAKLHALVQEYSINPNEETALAVANEYLKITSFGRVPYPIELGRHFPRLYAKACAAINQPMEMTLLAQANNLHGLFAEFYDEVDYTYYGSNIESITSKIESSFTTELAPFWKDRAKSAKNPQVIFLLWIGQMSPEGVVRSLPIEFLVVIQTEHRVFTERRGGVEALLFWRAFYRFDPKAGKYTCYMCPTDPLTQQLPRLDDLIADNFGLMLLNNLDMAADEIEYNGTELERYMDVVQDRADQRAQRLIQEAADAYDKSREDLEEMPTINSGQFSNLKEEIYVDLSSIASVATPEEAMFQTLHVNLPPGPHIKVWLSRMTRADGANYDHAVEVEIYNIADGRWEQYKEYGDTTDED